MSNDILYLVGDCIEDPSDRFNLIFVCRRFHDVFLPLLYRHVELRNSIDARSFLIAILQRPELARAVRGLDFHRWTCSCSSEKKKENINVNVNEILHLVASSSESPHERSQWLQDLHAENPEAWSALLLPILGNLRRVALLVDSSSTNGPSNYLDRTLQRAVTGQPPFHAQQPAFRHLQEVSLRHHLRGGNDTDSMKPSYAPTQMLPFFGFPAMRSIVADSVIEIDNHPTSSEAASSSSSITSIHLLTSNGHAGMAQLIGSCASLRSFKYQHSDTHLQGQGYRPAAFHRSLSRSRTSLRTLWLDSCGTHLPFTMSGLNETHDEWFGSLEGFTVLTDLRIRLPNLLDVRYTAEPSSPPLTEILPRSLERLYVEGCEERYLPLLVGQLGDLVSGKNKKEKAFQALKRVDVEGSFHDEHSGEGGDGDREESRIKARIYEIAEPLRLACLNAGVELYLRDRLCYGTMLGSP